MDLELLLSDDYAHLQREKSADLLKPFFVATEGTGEEPPKDDNDWRVGFLGSPFPMGFVDTLDNDWKKYRKADESERPELEKPGHIGWNISRMTSFGFKNIDSKSWKQQTAVPLKCCVVEAKRQETFHRRIIERTSFAHFREQLRSILESCSIPITRGGKTFTEWEWLDRFAPKNLADIPARPEDRDDLRTRTRRLDKLAATNDHYKEWSGFEKYVQGMSAVTADGTPGSRMEANIAHLIDNLLYLIAANSLRLRFRATHSNEEWYDPDQDENLKKWTFAPQLRVIDHLYDLQTSKRRCVNIIFQ
jgi:hypothetical protein